MSTGFEELVGQTIEAAYINEDNTCLWFVTTKGDIYTFFSEGDCCSHSWFEHIANVDELLLQEVLSVESWAPVPKEGDTPESESQQPYGYRLKTKAGSCDIDMRNESNGYYGGWVNFDGILDDLNKISQAKDLKPLKDF